MSDTNKAALPSCSFDQYIYGVCIELHSHMSTIIFSHWMAYFHPHLLPQLHCIRKHVVKKWKNENGNLQTAGRFTTAVKKTALTLWMKRWGKLAGPQWLKVKTTFPHQRSLNGRMYVRFSKVSQSAFWKFQCENTGRSSLGDLCQAPWCLTDGGRCCPGQSASG